MRATMRRLIGNDREGELAAALSMLVYLDRLTFRAIISISFACSPSISISAQSLCSLSREECVRSLCGSLVREVTGKFWLLDNFKLQRHKISPL